MEGTNTISLPKLALKYKLHFTWVTQWLLRLFICRHENGTLNRAWQVKHHKSSVAGNIKNKR